MKYLFDLWTDLRDRIQRARSVCLLFDYDGTLTPIVTRPDLALCPPEVRKYLTRLRDYPQVFVSVISGRPLEDLSGLIGVPGITYVGNHGLEIQNPAGIHKKSLSFDRRKELGEIQKTLKKNLGRLPGILFEDKESILSIHYRMVPKEAHKEVFQEMEEVRKKWGSRWAQMRGKMVFEIRPRVDFHKGKAVRDLLRIVPAGGLLPFYFGDDQTDEDAFRVLRVKGVTVFVGPPTTPTDAEYFLNNPPEVTEFLRRFIETFPEEDPPALKA